MMHPWILLLSMLPLAAPAATISSNQVVEDFSSLDYADLTSLSSSAATTGVWDVPRTRVRAHAFSDGDSSRPIDFGDGSDGVVNSSTGYAFDTDSHPNGYNFISLTITGGPITVTGRNPLVIRSLGAIVLNVPLDVSGPDASPGLLTGAAISGPTAITCHADGGNGGAATAVAGSNGGDGLQSDGTPEGFGNEGVGETTPAANNPLIDGQGSLNGPASNDFDNAANFICGASGPGGGGRSNGGVDIASGGAGGAGGGRVRLSAVGDIDVAAVLAVGGDGGNGIAAGAGPECSGNGSGGNGGAIWMQTLGNLSTSTNPDVSGGNSGVSPCFPGTGQSLIAGFTRGDTAAAGTRPGWAAGSFDTDNVPASVTSVVMSKAYPLGVFNAGFSTPTVTSSGTVTVEYAGSKDGTTFDAFTTDLTTLSDRNYRYLRWRATLDTGAGGTTPEITRIEIPFEELGLTQVDLSLAAGCASVRSIAGGSGPSDGSRSSSKRSNSHRAGSDIAGALFTLVAIAALYATTRPRYRL